MIFREYYNLFYVAQVGDFGNKQSTIDVISRSLDDVCDSAWNDCVSRNLLPKENVVSIKNQLNYMVIGLLVLYLNRRTPDSYADFMNHATGQINYLLSIGNNDKTNKQTV